MQRLFDLIELRIVELLIATRLRKDRRRATRLPCRIPAGIRDAVGSFQPIGGLVVDISRLGFQFHCSVSPPPAFALGAAILLRVKATGEKVQARIVRRVEDRLHCEFMAPLSRSGFRALLERIPMGRHTC